MSAEEAKLKKVRDKEMRSLAKQAKLTEKKIQEKHKAKPKKKSKQSTQLPAKRQLDLSVNDDVPCGYYGYRYGEPDDPLVDDEWCTCV